MLTLLCSDLRDLTEKRVKSRSVVLSAESDPACFSPVSQSHSRSSSVRPLSCIFCARVSLGWLGTGVVSVVDSGAVRPGFKSQPQRCRVTVLGKLFTPIMSLFTKQ